jgi:mannose-1-phosphate guanylyltransferase
MLKTKDMYAVILAGGSGERFWPMSTTRRPKQFLAIPSGKPLICAAVERIEKLIPGKQVFIITRQDLVNMVRRAMPSFPENNIIGEPCGRDTAAAVALGAALVKKRNPSAAFCVLTSDHLIGQHDLFRKTLREAFRLALSSDCLVTIGIKPASPSTGFGYIEAGKNFWRESGISAFKVRRFVEKPDLRTAKKYLRSGNFFWNSGMFIWSVAVLEKAIAAHYPRLINLIRAIEKTSGGKSFRKTLQTEYAKLRKISIDYALMEKAENIVMVRGDFIWDDIGSWAALERHCRKDKHGNVILGKGEALDARDNIVVAEDGLVALIGVRDLVVVRSAKATLVCARKKAQDVKQMVRLIANRKEYKGIT